MHTRLMQAKLMHIGQDPFKTKINFKIKKLGATT